MAQTNLNIRMDEDLKEQFEYFCNDVGMTMTTAVNIFAKKAVRENRIPFEVSGEKPNAETIKALEESERLLNDPNAKGYTNLDDMWKDLGL